VKVVFVHGGGPEISAMMKRLGKEVSFVDGLRVTDAETVDIVQMVLTGKVNKTLVTMLETGGGKAVGISGVDGRLIEARQKDPRLGFVGDIVRVNISPVRDLLDNGYIPVIAGIGCDAEGNIYNINGDTAAARIAGALGAERLLLMTDIDGIRRDVNDPSTMISELTRDEAAALITDGVVTGGMIPKVECCLTAVDGGVKNAVILDGRVPHSVLLELLTDEGAGTWIKGH
jgi:acetylglutamate kinase